VPGASHLGTGDHGPKTDRNRPRSVPVNALVVINGLLSGQLENTIEKRGRITSDMWPSKTVSNRGSFQMTEKRRNGFRRARKCFRMKVTPAVDV
jgi:hypothetical protein